MAPAAVRTAMDVGCGAGGGMHGGANALPERRPRAGLAALQLRGQHAALCGGLAGGAPSAVCALAVAGGGGGFCAHGAVPVSLLRLVPGSAGGVHRLCGTGRGAARAAHGLAGLGRRLCRGTLCDAPRDAPSDLLVGV